MTSIEPAVAATDNQANNSESLKEKTPPNHRKLYKIPEEDCNKHPTCPPEKGNHVRLIAVLTQFPIM